MGKLINMDANQPSQGASRGAGLVLFAETDTFFDAMLAAIATARKRVWMETYIFSADSVGWRFAEALAERARAGVDVRLQVDSAGAMEAPRSKRIKRYLAVAGVELRWFNRLRRLLPSQINRRDHRKLLAVDDRYVFVGSSNIVWSNSPQVCGDHSTHQLDLCIEPVRVPQVRQFVDALWDESGPITNAWRPVPEGESQLVPNSPHDRTRPLRSVYRALFDWAESSVYLAVGFFVPDEGTVRTVEQAAQRGVDVHLILPGHTDMPPALWAGHALYARLLDAGVHIHEYLPSILHVKAAVADGQWALLGSGNFDNRSFFLNYELNLESRDTAFCQTLQNALIDDLDRCEPITRNAWRRRTWWARTKEILVWPFRGHL